MIKIDIKVADNKQKCEWENDRCKGIIYEMEYDNGRQSVHCVYHLRLKVNQIVSDALYVVNLYVAKKKGNKK